MTWIKLVVHYLDENIEKHIMFLTYAACACIICGSVIDRFVFRHQAPWSSTLPVYLFLWFTWIGASYNTKKRTNLVFIEIRQRLPYKVQFVLQMLDSVLWVTFASIVIYYSWEVVILQRENFSLVAGTDDLQLWPFYLAVPFSWSLLVFRVVQNTFQDILRFIAKEPFVLVGEFHGD